MFIQLARRTALAVLLVISICGASMVHAQSDSDQCYDACADTDEACVDQCADGPEGDACEQACADAYDAGAV